MTFNRNVMKKQLLSLAFVFAVGTSAFAQFPGGGGGGFNRGGGFGNQNQTDGVRGRRETDATGIPGTANDPTPRGNSKITGYVVDSSVTKAVEFANVALYSKTTGKPVDGAVADEKGKFSLTRVAPGDYKLMLTFIGFNTKTIDNLKVERSKDIDLGVVKLTPSVKTLDEVTVTGQASMIEEKVDRLVYNAEKDVTSRGGDAADVLRKVPMLQVDLDGNVQLRGNSNIRVLINNKPSTIVASSVADALKMLPADMIKSVEVITSPSARYDAEGSSGIINIITKKNTLQGLTLNVDSGVGNRSSNLGLNGNYRKGKMGLSLGGFGRAIYNPSSSTSDQTSLQGGNSFRTSQQSSGNDRGIFGHYNLGFDYDLAKDQSLTASVRYGLRNMNRDQNLFTDVFQNDILTQNSSRDVLSKNTSGNVDVNVDYLRTFKPQQEWSISSQFSRNDLTNNFDADLFNGIGNLTGRQQNINHSNNQEVTIQTDYQTPIGKNQLIEFGGKGILRTVLSDYTYLTAGPTGDFATDAKNLTGSLDYSQNIAAGYLSYTFQTKNKYTFKVGSRYERTFIDASTREGGALAIPDYSNLVPSVNISKSFSGKTLKLAYNRRIQRPGIQQLNPNVNLANPQNISVGNPNLRPELTDNFELSLSTNLKKAYINASLFTRLTDNSITQIRRPSDLVSGAIQTTFENIGSEHAYGANVFTNITITPKWTIGGGFDAYYARLQGQVADLGGVTRSYTNGGLVVGGRFMTQLTIKNGWGVQGFGGARGRQVQLQGTQGSFYMYSLGVRKELPNKKGSVGLAAENFFGGMRMRTELTSPLLSQVMVNNIYNQSVKLTFNYKIGKMSFTPTRRRTRSVSNDDVKGDGGGDNGGGQQQSAPAAPAGGQGGGRPR